MALARKKMKIKKRFGEDCSRLERAFHQLVSGMFSVLYVGKRCMSFLSPCLPWCLLRVLIRQVYVMQIKTDAVYSVLN